MLPEIESYACDGISFFTYTSVAIVSTINTYHYFNGKMRFDKLNFNSSLMVIIFSTFRIITTVYGFISKVTDLKEKYHLLLRFTICSDLMIFMCLCLCTLYWSRLTDPYYTKRFRVAYILMVFILIEIIYTFFQSDLIDIKSPDGEVRKFYIVYSSLELAIFIAAVYGGASFYINIVSISRIYRINDLRTYTLWLCVCFAGIIIKTISQILNLTNILDDKLFIVYFVSYYPISDFMICMGVSFCLLYRDIQYNANKHTLPYIINDIRKEDDNSTTTPLIAGDRNINNSKKSYTTEEKYLKSYNVKTSSFSLESYQHFKHTASFAVRVSSLPKRFKFYKMLLYKIDSSDSNNRPNLVCCTESLPYRKILKYTIALKYELNQHEYTLQIPLSSTTFEVNNIQFLFILYGQEVNQCENYDYEKIVQSNNTIFSNDIALEDLLKLKQPYSFHNSNNIELMVYFMGLVSVNKSSCNTQYYVVWNDSNEPILSKETLYETELSFNIPLLWMKIAESNTTRMMDEVNSLIEIASVQASKLIRKDSFGDVIQTNNILLSNIEENKYLLERIKNHLESIKICENVCKEGKINDGKFKPSVLKTEKMYQFIPTNLHFSDYVVYDTNSQEILQSDWPFVFPIKCEVFTTSGIPAAHTMKFEHGGINSIVKDLRKLSIPPISENLYYWNIRERLDKTIAQALSTIITDFAIHLSKLLYSKDYVKIVKQYQSIGYLCFIESLLSCSGNENGMIEDAYSTYLCTNAFAFKLIYTKSDKNGFSKVDNTNISIKEEIHHSSVFTYVITIPIILQADYDDNELTSDYIYLVPVFFNQGVNGYDVISRITGKCILQKEINNVALTLLNKYTLRYMLYKNRPNYGCNESGVTFAGSFEKGLISMVNLCNPELIPCSDNEIDEKLLSVISLVNSSHSKEYNIFLLLTDVVSMLNGGHVIMCKSGKDRTSMSVTIQQVNSLYKSHSISGEQRDHLIDCMRIYGVRLSVAQKNTGTAKYAFNPIQRSFLYSPFRPPSIIVDDKIET